ncbi:MAG: hypothetical protein WCS53_01235 [Bacilli bacterium]
MSVQTMLREAQPIAHQTLQQAFRHRQVSHAYLLSGPPGAPLQETAVFLAQSVLCEHPDPLACETCMNCIRVADGSYADFIRLDGSQGSIKKEDVEQVLHEFSRTALEVHGYKVYILHLVEQATPSAVNSLLKFLEEPTEQTVAILTTENMTKVLPTIISRCQTIRLKNHDRHYLIEAAVARGYDRSDATLLTQQYGDMERMVEALDNAQFHRLKDAAVETVMMLSEQPERLPFWIQREVAGIVASRQECALYLDLLAIFWKDMIRSGAQEIPLFESLLPAYRRLMQRTPKMGALLQDLLLLRGSLDSNVNTSLLLDRMSYRLLQEGGIHHG